MEIVTHICVSYLTTKNLICRDRATCIIFGCYNKKIHEQIKGFAITLIPYCNHPDTIGE